MIRYTFIDTFQREGAIAAVGDERWPRAVRQRGYETHADVIQVISIIATSQGNDF